LGPFCADAWTAANVRPATSTIEIDIFMAVIMWQMEMRQNKWQKEINSTADQKTEEVKFIT
jgi:hypothetical protein